MILRFKTIFPTADEPLAGRWALLGGTFSDFKHITLEGGLQPTGKGRWAGPHISFEGGASAAPEHEVAPANFLNISVRRDDQHFITTAG